MAGVGAVAVLGPAVAFVVGYALLAVPTPDEAVERQVAVLSYADGSVLTRLSAPDGRPEVPVEDVPLPVRRAVVAARDPGFFDQPAVDVVAAFRTALEPAPPRGQPGRAAPLTEQYVAAALGEPRSPGQRFRALVVTVKIARERSRDEILGDYLNATYFGRGAYGIAAASRAYFGRDVRDLTIAEGAVLGAAIDAPAQDDPAVGPDRGAARWRTVLDVLVDRGWLTSAQRGELPFPATSPYPSTPPLHGRDGHLAAAVVAELAEVGISERDVAQGGLRVTTTIDARRQRQAVTATAAGATDALVAVDPRNGGVLAYDGGDGEVDSARRAAPAGAAFGPFAVLAGLRRDPPVGPEPDLDALVQPVGPEPDLDALVQRVGPQSVADAARTAGIALALDAAGAPGRDGAPDVTAVDLASAYATIAAGGTWHRPHLVSVVGTADGRVLYRAATDGGRRFPVDVAHAVTQAMLDAAASRGPALPGGRAVAVVTDRGTTVGFVPSLVAVVRRDPDGGGPDSGQTWHDFVAAAVDGDPVEPFPVR